MSDIRGDGYGSQHDWMYLGSTPFKTSSYTCKRCKAGFQHNYDDEPNIFAAMLFANVSKECKPKS